MKPFRKNVALAVDGGGIKGVIATRALSMLEDHLHRSCHSIFSLMAGTSTGAIVSGGIACQLSAAMLTSLYAELGEYVFRKGWRNLLFPISRYRYSNRPLETMLKKYVGDRKMGDLWDMAHRKDLVITAFDLVANKTRFIKPWKEEYRNWPLAKAILASSSVPTYFPVIEGRYVDGGVGSYSNPCYLAAYEALNCLEWDPAETTLISLGTGRGPHKMTPGQADNYFAWQWISPVLGAFLQSADDQQVHLVDSFFGQLDFRRFQVDLQQPIEMDDPGHINQLLGYGEEMGNMILNDITDYAMEQAVPKATS